MNGVGYLKQHMKENIGQAQILDWWLHYFELKPRYIDANATNL